ncbi:MAG: NAD-dependent epimerase/dehydratase family protein [bacterium]|nr:NAD-dependent epimerase/dehydratase family protein [bacterium]
MKICVVGGTGNISTSFVKLLLEQGHDVTCFNRGQRGQVPEGAKVIIGDRANREDFERKMQQEKFDAAIDMICFSSEDAQSDLRAFRGVSHFVQCSTVLTYGLEMDWLPATEDHPLRATDPYGHSKIEADAVFMAAYYGEDFPVTIIKPSTTIGPQNGPLRQLGRDFSWVDRIRKGLPMLVLGNGNQALQMLDVDDAALCFANVVGKEHCIGHTYNMVRRGYTTWKKYHQTAMKVLGNEVELVGITLDDLKNLNGFTVPGYVDWVDSFAYNAYFSSDKLMRDVPEFQPVIPLEVTLERIIVSVDRAGRIPSVSPNNWEDQMIAALRTIRTQTIRL